MNPDYTDFGQLDSIRHLLAERGNLDMELVTDDELDELTRDCQIGVYDAEIDEDENGDSWEEGAGPYFDRVEDELLNRGYAPE